MERALQELAELTGSQLIGDPHHCIRGVESLESASSEEASFCANSKYRPLLQTTRAGLICIDPETPLIPGKNFLVSSNPSETFQTLIKLFLGEKIPSTGFSGIHPSAVIHPSATIGANVSIGPLAVIDQGCTIGAYTRIGAHVSVGPGVAIGPDCIIHPNVTIREGCRLGSRVTLQPGCVIGSCGYGYTTNASGQHIKQEQLGIVILEDDVEVGANTTIDRGRFQATRIGTGTKVDNLVQIGHNVSLGPYNLIVSQTGISGSVTTGRYVIMGGQTGTVGHINICDKALFAARSGIKKSILQPGKYGGNPAISLGAHNRNEVYLKKIEALLKRIEALEAACQKNFSLR